MTAAQRKILKALDVEEWRNRGAVAGRAKSTATSVGRALEQLAEEGLVAKRVVEGKRGFVVFRLTGAGIEALKG